jgi:hypothetical protein
MHAENARGVMPQISLDQSFILPSISLLTRQQAIFRAGGPAQPEKTFLQAIRAKLK